MNNPETQPGKNFAQSESNNAPVFSQNVIPQTLNNVAPQIPNSSLLKSSNVEPQNSLEPNDEESVTENLDSLKIENTNSVATENVEPHQEENVAPANLEKSVVKKKSRKKVSKKNTHSQKRNVVPLKFFCSPEEKTGLEIKAKEKRLSLSNYIRVNLELLPNTTGRKKANGFLLDSVNLDSDIEDAFANLHK